MADRRKPMNHTSSGDTSHSKTVKHQIGSRYGKCSIVLSNKTLTWLHCDMETGNASVVSLLWCEKFVEATRENLQLKEFFKSVV